MARHLAGIEEFFKALSEQEPGRAVVFHSLPAPEQVAEKGIGFFLN